MYSPAVRRKFFELYRLPAPPNTPLSRTTSPTTSPTKNDPVSPNHQALTLSPSAIISDPFSHMLLEVVKLIQACLVLWGMVSDNVEIDGLFCDETKQGVFAWRRSMGMEHEESMRLEVGQTVDACLLLIRDLMDRRKRAAGVSTQRPSQRFSVRSRVLDTTSTRWTWKRFPKIRCPTHAASCRPGMRIRYVILDLCKANLEAAYRPSHERVEYLTVPSIRALNAHYLNERTRSPDALKMPRLLLSGVASATSTLHANLKGGGQEDTPLRKREHHHFRTRPEELPSDSGFNLIVPAGEAGVYAPPDIITSDLEAYTRGILKSREKDWDVMGARRIGALWSGQTELGKSKSHRRLNGGVLRKKTHEPEADDGDEGSTRGALGKISEKTGLAIKGGLGLVR